MVFGEVPFSEDVFEIFDGKKLDFNMISMWFAVHSKCWVLQQRQLVLV